MSISSDEINCLIYRYLQENGFSHSAFTFAYESLVIKSSAAQTEIPPGALITFLQKGLEYIAIEEHISEDGTIQEFENNYTLLSPLICEALAVKEDRRVKSNIPPSRSSMDLGQSAPAVEQTAMEVDAPDTGASSTEFSAAAIPPSSSAIVERSGMKLLNLKGHLSEVHSFAWNPIRRQLATASPDGVARLWGIWEMTPEKWNSSESDLSLTTCLLPHKLHDSQKLCVVNSVSWSPNGLFLATACNDGIGRIWDDQGNLIHSLRGHEGAMLTVKFSRSGQHLVSRGVDRQVIVWTVADGKALRSLQPHSEGGPEVDWRDHETFATGGGKDLMICICQVSSSESIKRLSGHTQEINSICWSPSGQYLASGSDDHTAKIWTIDGLKHDLKGHTQEVLLVDWTPARAPGSLRLCSASVDGSVKIWHAETAQLLHSLTKYGTPVCSLSISVDGKYLACGTHSGRVSVWALESGEIVHELRVGKSDNYEVGWSHDGALLSASFVDNALVVIDGADIAAANGSVNKS